MVRDNPLISVIVPSYNHERFIEQAISSVLNQTYKNIELIVIDDGSRDRSPLIVQDLSDKHGFYFENQINMGLSATLNKGVNLSSGEYISLLASDDYWELNKIEILVNEFQKLGDEYGVVSGDAKFVDKNGKNTKKAKDGKTYRSFLHHAIAGIAGFDLATDFGRYETFITDNYVPAMSTVIRKSALFDAGLYDEEHITEDWSFWFKISKLYKFHYVDRSLANYRIHDANTVTIMSDRLTLDLLEILIRERPFCYENGFSDLWDMRYYGLVLSLLKKKKIKSFLKHFSWKEAGKFVQVASTIYKQF